jgi:AraC-like DNA-binding protein
MIKPNLKTMLESLRATDEKANIDTLAKNCYTSAMQLQRDFYNVTGYSVNEYMRRLRLSNALCLIKNSSCPLADIAYSCGYSSQQALCREIKSILNTTATAYKESGSYYFLSALTDDAPFQIEVSKVAVPETVCLRYYSHILRGIENNAVNLFLHANPGYGGRIPLVRPGPRHCRR